MNDEALRALRGSIEKWRAIVNRTGGDDGIRNCPLCQLYYEGNGCPGCPVAEHTGEGFCRGTPYTDWTAAFSPTRYMLIADTPYRVALAERELAFLESLLPTEEKVMASNLPPGVTDAMIEAQFADRPCDVCGVLPDDCVCPKCPTCSEQGNLACYSEHGLTMSHAQMISKAACDVNKAREILQEAEMYLDQLTRHGPPPEEGK